jgi:outer membrane protein
MFFGNRKEVLGIFSASAISILMASACVFAYEPSAQAAEMKACSVNLARVFEMYQRTKDSEGSLESKGKQKQSELEGKFSELKKMREGLELLSDQAKEAKAREIEEKADSFKRLKDRSERELLKERNQVARVILDDIEKVIEEYAKANGYSMVVDQRMLLYGEPAYDITEQVLKILNDRYAAQGPKTSKR